MQEEWQKERKALLISIKEKEDRLKDFEKVRCQQHFHLLPEHVVCALRSDSTPILLRWFLVCTALIQDKMVFFFALFHAKLLKRREVVMNVNISWGKFKVSSRLPSWMQSFIFCSFSIYHLMTETTSITAVKSVKL